jgi:hypothetical protein
MDGMAATHPKRFSERKTISLRRERKPLRICQAIQNHLQVDIDLKQKVDE